jgi:anthranilate synthase component 1
VEDASEFDADGTLDDAADSGDQRITVRAGAGIVADSDPTSEYVETEQKMGGVLDALEAIENGADDETDTAAETVTEEVSR